MIREEFPTLETLSKIGNFKISNIKVKENKYGTLDTYFIEFQGYPGFIKIDVGELVYKDPIVRVSVPYEFATKKSETIKYTDWLLSDIKDFKFFIKELTKILESEDLREYLSKNKFVRKYITESTDIDFMKIIKDMRNKFTKDFSNIFRVVQKQDILKLIHKDLEIVIVTDKTGIGVYSDDIEIEVLDFDDYKNEKEVVILVWKIIEEIVETLNLN